jgi:small subunit ribosomal protein S23
MVRRIASQVHKQAARLMRTEYLSEEPVWFKAVLEHPPLPLPPRKTALRTAYDLPPPRKQSAATKKMKPYTPRPLPISYIEDDVRRQFFKDHPFQAFRPTSLVEGAGIVDEHPIRGKTWTRLRQRGRNPSSEEYVWS